MKDLVATLYSPGVEAKYVEKLKEKYAWVMKEWGFINSKKPVPFDPSYVRGAFAVNPLAVLIVGWGLEETPDWQRLLSVNLQGVSIQHFFGIDLYERKGTRGRVFKKPKIMAGPLHAKKTVAGTMELFLKKFWVIGEQPYGLRKHSQRRNPNDHPRKFVLKAGDEQEVEVVKFIFDQFGNQGMSRQNICNLLNAQKVVPPGKAPLWRSNNVNKILTEPAYIGATRFKGCILHNAFPPVLDPALYFQAQVRMHRERMEQFRQDAFREEKE